MFDQSIAIAHTRNRAEQSSQPVNYLLNEYPLPTERSSPELVHVIFQCHSRFWLVHQSARITDREGNARRLLFKVCREHGAVFLNQNLLRYLCNAPADCLHIRVLHGLIVEENNMLNLRGFQLDNIIDAQS
jgi:hypothetical protein